MGKGKEDEDGRSYWIDLLTNVLGMDNVTERLNFEKKVVIDGNTKRIDVYIPETRVIIEQKSLGKALDQKIRNSGDVDLTPFEQADRYNGKLTFDERARWIVTSNFAEIWIYDMNQKQPEPTKIALDELQSKYPLLDFLVKKEVKTISHEMEVSIKAGDIVGLIYDAFLKQYRIPDIKEKDETSEQKEKREHKLKSLNALCVRIVFCLYAEDAGILGKRNMFHDYLETYEVRDCRRALIELFKVLDTPISDRDEYLEEDLAQFPYVNGGLFADETIEIPPFTEEIKELLLTKASEDFDWSDISPTIFGAVFESTLNPETRRSGGMHYTSIENIHKVIDPLFLEDLQEEFNAIKQIQVKRTKDKKLDEFQNKLATLTFLDPACGSGNFLTETYLSLRRLENEVIRERVGGQMTLVEAHAECFRNNLKPNQCGMSIPKEEGIERINVVIFGLKNTTMIPYILYIAKNVQDKNELIKMYGILESYIMRRVVVHASTKSYNNLFTSLILNKVLDSQTLTLRLKGIGDATTYCPDDNEMKIGFETSKLVNLQSKGIIYLLESKIRSDNSSTALLGFNNYSLEHLMPKKWRNNWGACATEDDAKKRDSLLLTLGNLAIIPQALNASIRDAAWNVKKAGNT
ncbi:type IIL restriction-modification enzyme MmeI [[Clostridium] scindens]|uniref:type IIL restriction-modification enzyme MmeI n=1 Tax=Clostridium scindens (strain JCM 10418 / VPI 12708) TaxID=29347 RepID=UPI003F821279